MYDWTNDKPNQTKHIQFQTNRKKEDPNDTDNTDINITSKID